jgi:hypothetical protein
MHTLKMTLAKKVSAKKAYKERSVKKLTNKKLVARMVAENASKFMPKGIKEYISINEPKQIAHHKAVFGPLNPKIITRTTIIKLRPLNQYGNPLINATCRLIVRIIKKI